MCSPTSLALPLVRKSSFFCQTQDCGQGFLLCMCKCANTQVDRARTSEQCQPVAPQSLLIQHLLDEGLQVIRPVRIHFIIDHASSIAISVAEPAYSAPSRRRPASNKASENSFLYRPRKFYSHKRRRACLLSTSLTKACDY